MTYTLTLNRGTLLVGTAHFTPKPDGSVDIWEVSSNTDGGMGGKFTVEKARDEYRKKINNGWKKEV